MLDESKASKQRDRVKRVSRQRVPEVWDARDVAGDQPSERFGVNSADRPHGEIRNQVELNSADESGYRQPCRGLVASNNCPDKNANAEAGVDDRHQFVKPNKSISHEQRRYGIKKRLPVPAQLCAAEKRHRTYGREIPGVRQCANHCGKRDETQDHCKT